MQTKFGTDTSSAVNKTFQLGEASKYPGPGHYAAFSEFAGYETK